MCRYIYSPEILLLDLLVLLEESNISERSIYLTHRKVKEKPVTEGDVKSVLARTLVDHVKDEPELTDPFNLLINVKLRML